MCQAGTAMKNAFKMPKYLSFTERRLNAKEVLKLSLQKRSKFILSLTPSPKEL